VLVARPDAALYFANMAFLESWLDDALRRRADDAGEPVRAVVLDCSAVNDIDAVALEALERRLDTWDGVGVALHLAGVKGPVRDMLARSGFTQRHPERVGHLSVSHALEVLGARLEGTSDPLSDPLSSEPSPSEPSPSEPSTATSAGASRRRATGGTP